MNGAEHGDSAIIGNNDHAIPFWSNESVIYGRN